MSKDLFSSQAGNYAKYRPTYPEELFQYILGFVQEKNHAWDCATGNGQAAKMLAPHFKKVDASDISESQLAHAERISNIQYHLFPAEHTTFEESRFDLITVAQAYHWLHWKKFHDEATRTGKKGAVVAIWAYNLFYSEEKNLNDLIDRFYYEVIGPYWDPERKYVDDAYSSVDFHFSPLPSRDFVSVLWWTRDHFVGYLQSWSAVQHYEKKNGSSPLNLIHDQLDHLWQPGEAKKILFPIFMKLGRVEK